MVNDSTLSQDTIDELLGGPNKPGQLGVFIVQSTNELTPEFKGALTNVGVTHTSISPTSRNPYENVLKTFQGYNAHLLIVDLTEVESLSAQSVGAINFIRSARQMKHIPVVILVDEDQVQDADRMVKREGLFGYLVLPLVEEKASLMFGNAIQSK